MRLNELLVPQEASKKKEPDGTVAEVFIIESLRLVDEAKQRHEGEVLNAVLRMCAKKPLYYYIRTKAELQYLATVFEDSRYLHISCHGGNTTLDTTLDEVDYAELAKIFAGKLAGRRLFVSACSAGNEMFAELLGSKNERLISVAAPSEDIYFQDAVAFWTAFYVKAFSINQKSMNSERLIGVFRPLADLFNVPIHFSVRGRRPTWSHQAIRPSGNGKNTSSAGSPKGAGVAKT